MLEWLKVLVLGVVEGVTEFLPISSTGHLIVFSTLLQFQPHLRDTFDIFIQIGAVAAVIAYYHHELGGHVRALPTDRDTQQFWLRVVIACIPAALLGIVTKAWIKQVLFTPVVVALALIVGGVVMLMIERWLAPTLPPSDAAHADEDWKSVTLRQALVVGAAQMVALVPGVSRSGASIMGGMVAGMSRQSATRFSFFLAIPTLGGATLYELLTSLDAIQPGDLAYLLGGALVSAVVAWASVRWLLTYVAHNTFVPFSIYRIGAGIVILLLVLSGALPVPRL